jgi:hypothetical protein
MLQYILISIGVSVILSLVLAGVLYAITSTLHSTDFLTSDFFTSDDNA